MTVVVGGYDPSLAPEAYEAPDAGVDFLVRGEGELTFRELLARARARRSPLRSGRFPACRSTTAGASATTRRGTVSGLDDGAIALPNRGARVLDGYTFLGRPIDIVETSRGCTYDCSFCSIIEMRGRNFHTFDFERVLADIADARARGARAIFIVDDNITLNVARFEALCRAIVDAGLNDIHYIVQAMTSSIANHGDDARAADARGRLPLRVPRHRERARRGPGVPARVGEERAPRGRPAHPATRRCARSSCCTATACTSSAASSSAIPATRASRSRPTSRSRDEYVDWPYIQHPTPYPGTPMTKDFRERGLIVNERVEEYDGTTAVVRTEHLSADEIEFMRWRAERWMKLRHMPAALRHYPGFVLRHGLKMLAHTFRGSTWRSALGLEDSRAVFARYKAIRRAEREYLPSPERNDHPSMGSGARRVEGAAITSG